MTEADKTRMLEALLVGVPKDTAAYRELEELCAKDVQMLEPIFDEILRRELLAFTEFIVGNMVKDGFLGVVHLAIPQLRLATQERFLEQRKKGVGT